MTIKDGYAIYARRSSEDAENQRNSLDYQETLARRYAADHSLQLAALTEQNFIKAGVIRESHTAFKTSELTIGNHGKIEFTIERPKFQKLVGLLARGTLRGVIALCFDRLSRNKQDELVIAQLINMGVDVRFVTTSYEKTSSGALHMSLDAMVAQHASMRTSERVRATLVKLRDEGKCWYRTPLGYLDDGPANKPIDWEDAPRVRRLFELYASGDWSHQQLAQWAKKVDLRAKPTRAARSAEEILAGLPNENPATRRHLSRNAIAKMLKNPFYIGKVVHKGLAVDGIHQPLIDVRLFQRVQDMLEQRCTSVRYLDGRLYYPYRGLLKCCCGRAYSPYLKKGHVYYRVICKPGCTNSARNLSEAHVDDLIAALFGNARLSAEELATLEADRSDGVEILRAEADKLRADLALQEKRARDDLRYIRRERITLLRTGSMTAEELSADVVRLEAELADIQKRRAETVESPRNDGVSRLELIELLETAQQTYKSALTQQKHELAALAVLELVIADRKLAGLSPKPGFARLLGADVGSSGSPKGNRTPVFGMKTRCPNH